MDIRKILLMTSVLVIWIISGSLAHSYSSGRAAKILEDPIVPQDWNHETSSRESIVLKDKSDRSLSAENNMMLYRSVFTISLKLLSVFLLCKLLSYSLGRAGLLRQKTPVDHLNQQLLYTVDVNHNPVPTTLITQGSTGVPSVATPTATAGVPVVPQQTVPFGGYIVPAATNPRPSFLLPRFRFGPRHPPLRPRHPFPPPGPGGVTHHNMGEETHFVETHSHVYVMPDGSQARIPYPTTVVQNTQQKPAASSPQGTAQSSSSTKDSKASADSSPAASSTSDATTEQPAAAASNAVESVSISTSSSSSTSAERRSSPVFREKQQPLLHHQHYDDWSLHFNPGT